MATTVLEGTWEEIQRHSSILRGHRLRVSILDEEDLVKPEPNYRMSDVMKKAKAVQKNMRQTDGSQTQQILREGRDEGMLIY